MWVWIQKPSAYPARRKPGRSTSSSDLDDSLSFKNEEAPGDGDLITVTFTLPVEARDLSALFFRIEKEG